MRSFLLLQHRFICGVKYHKRTACYGMLSMAMCSQIVQIPRDGEQSRGPGFKPRSLLVKAPQLAYTSTSACLYKYLSLLEQAPQFACTSLGALRLMTIHYQFLPSDHQMNNCSCFHHKFDTVKNRFFKYLLGILDIHIDPTHLVLLFSSCTTGSARIK